ncbi:hypothetical protein BC936DRAFT_143577 [Jimgerdemannia flammicorona]|uniref:Uncharacterized protein n=2 Tax=Jimgerdemannia flammicorona TaxID=994334 RepID=A0A433QRZ5_9FUNG|nr:hypothetical protein BC936DRAFT_143577 [Jimgerdemannia flammicorona]RUS32550.1 hypothetical protein BC938DRAFT_475112 [Jimgerdemannia flammicorona]
MSGLQLTPLMVGIVTFAGLTGATAKFIRSYRPYMWIGSATLTVGVAMMSTLSEESNRAMEIAYVFLVGSGVGMTIQMMLLAAQGAVVGEDVAIVTALTQFFQNIGGAIGICIYSTVLQNALPKNVMSVVPPELLTPNVTLAVSQSITSIQSHLPPAVIPYVVHAYVLSLQSSFRVGIPIAGASFLALLFVKGQRLGGSGKPVEKEAAEV